MKLSEMFPRRFVGGEDLQGKAWTLTISGVRQEEVRVNAGAAPEQKHIVYFEETQKGVILSRTLAYQIGNALGSEDTAEWVGKKITLYPESMMVAGKHRVGIRARKAGVSGDL